MISWLPVCKLVQCIEFNTCKCFFVLFFNAYVYLCYICRFATLANYQVDHGNSSSEDEGQAFYAGGSEHRYISHLMRVWPI